MTGRQKGEGNRDAARRYNESAREFIESDADDAALEELRKDEVPDELTEPEERARERAKELDPNTRRDYDDPSR